MYDTALGSGADFDPPTVELTGSEAGVVVLDKLAGDAKGSTDDGGSPGYDGTIVGNPSFGPVKFGHGHFAVAEDDNIPLPDFSGEVLAERGMTAGVAWEQVFTHKPGEGPSVLRAVDENSSGTQIERQYHLDAPGSVQAITGERDG